jgi:hypothetical protein
MKAWWENCGKLLLYNKALGIAAKKPPPPDRAVKITLCLAN